MWIIIFTYFCCDGISSPMRYLTSSYTTSEKRVVSRTCDCLVSCFFLPIDANTELRETFRPAGYQKSKWTSENYILSFSDKWIVFDCATVVITHYDNSLKFVPKIPINTVIALVQIMTWRRPGDKPLSEQMLVCLSPHIYGTWPQWVNFVLTFAFACAFR